MHDTTHPPPEQRPAWSGWPWHPHVAARTRALSSLADAYDGWCETRSDAEAERLWAALLDAMTLAADDLRARRASR